MVSVFDFFSGLYRSAQMPVLVFGEDGQMVYGSSAVADLLNRIGEEQETALISPAVQKEMARCLEIRQGISLPTQINDHLLTLFMVPYFLEDKRYLVMQVEEKSVAVENEQLKCVFRNSQGKLMSYLNDIYGMAQSIGLDTPEGKEIGFGVRRIMRMSNHLYQALDGEGKTEYRIPIDVGSFVSGFVRNFNEIMPGTRVFSAPFVPDLFVKMMPEDMEMVVGTLLSNAIRFGGEEVTVRTRTEEELVYLTVFDNGAGVKDPQKLFQWGYRTPDKRGAKGLGFSLAMAKKLLEHQGAQLLYEKTEEGASFHVIMKREARPFVQMAEWSAEPLENSLSQIRVEMSDLAKER